MTILPLIAVTAITAAAGPVDLDASTPLTARVSTEEAAEAPSVKLETVRIAGRQVTLDTGRVRLDPGEGADLRGAVVQLTWTGDADDVTVFATDRLLPEVGAGRYQLPEVVPAQLEIFAWKDGHPVDLHLVQLGPADWM